MTKIKGDIVCQYCGGSVKIKQKHTFQDCLNYNKAFSQTSGEALRKDRMPAGDHSLGEKNKIPLTQKRICSRELIEWSSEDIDEEHDCNEGKCNYIYWEGDVVLAIQELKKKICYKKIKGFDEIEKLYFKQLDGKNVEREIDEVFGRIE